MRASDADHPHLSHTSRRNILFGLGALGAAAVVPKSVFGQGTATGVIDTHHHFYPPEYLKTMIAWEQQRKLFSLPAHAAWSPAKSIEEMDKNGIAVSVLSIASTPGVWLDVGPAAASQLARSSAEYGAEVVRDNKGRFALFAPLSMLDIDATLKEVEYVLDTLKADGVGLQTSYGDKWLGDPVYKPVLEELNRRKAVVYVHPLAAACCGRLSVGVTPPVIEVPHDTTRAVASLLTTGTLMRLRDIRWLFSHGGGTVPMLAGRIAAFYPSKVSAAFAPDGIEAELQRLYYDTANATHPASMAALRALVPASQITFGSDYPYFQLSQIQDLRKAGFTPADLRAIESGNAMELMPRLKA